MRLSSQGVPADARARSWGEGSRSLRWRRRLPTIYQLPARSLPERVEIGGDGGDALAPHVSSEVTAAAGLVIRSSSYESVAAIMIVPPVKLTRKTA